MTKLTISGLSFLACVWTLFLQVNGQSYQDLYKLHQDLLGNYSTHMRPLLNQSHRIVLFPSFHLITLVELDEIKQKLTINGQLGLRWKDELLTWNPISYNGISRISPDSTLVWKPRIALLNTMSDRDLFRDDYAPIQIDFDGNVSWFPGGLFPLSCLLDLRKFPFDEHSCRVALAPMYMDMSEAIFDLTSSLVSQSIFYPHGGWDISETSISSTFLDPGANFSYPMLVVELKISRKPAFFIFNVYFPVLFLCAVNALTFMIPPDEGEKIGFSITVLLAISVYMGVVSDNLPANSTNMPYMTHYIFVLFALSVMCCVDNVFIVWLHNREEDKDKKQKSQSQLKNVFGRLRIFNAFQQTSKPSANAKIFPHPSSDVDAKTQNDEDASQRPGPDVQTFDPDVSQSSLHDQLKTFNSKANLPFPRVKSTDKDCSKRDPVQIQKTRYKNTAHKFNYYSGILFCLISFTLTIVHLVLMIS